MATHISLLVVEPNPTLLPIVSRFLNEHNVPKLEVAGATSDLNIALDLAVALKPRMVLIGLEHNIPGALELIGELRALEPASKILVIAPLAIAEYRQVVLAAGADHMLGREALYRKLIPAILHLADCPATTTQHAQTT